jgi:tRNA G18 (ribose-2'-O)-methylase SpoU
MGRVSSDDAIPEDRERLTVGGWQDIWIVVNLGGLVRLSAGFGADAMILGERSHDPFWRQSVRVSMGTIFTLPIVQSENLLGDLLRLKSEWGIELIATVLDANAQPLAASRRKKRTALLFGGEAQGLDAEVVRACDRRVTIPMHHGTDSLNVAVAAGICLYHFTREDVFTSP